VDDNISKQVLEVVQPVAVQAALLANDEQARQHDDAVAALRRDLEAARYAAKRAQKQYDEADPENRLVAGELERRWNDALQRVREIESRIESYGMAEKSIVATPAEFADLAEQLDIVWNDPLTEAALKKRIVRT
jgi:hypothetical protein